MPPDAAVKYFVWGPPGEQVDTMTTQSHLVHRDEKHHVLVATFDGAVDLPDARRFWHAAQAVDLRAPEVDTTEPLKAAVVGVRVLEERNRALGDRIVELEQAVDIGLAQLNRREEANRLLTARVAELEHEEGLGDAIVTRIKASMDWEIEGNMRKWIENNARSQGESGWRCLENAAPTEHLARAILAYRDEIARKLAPFQRGDLQHALGSGAGRNHFVCGGTDNTATGFAGWIKMVELGVAERGPDINNGRDSVFRATTFGIEIARVLRG